MFGLFGKKKRTNPILMLLELRETLFGDLPLTELLRDKAPDPRKVAERVTQLKKMGDTKGAKEYSNKKMRGQLTVEEVSEPLATLARSRDLIEKGETERAKSLLRDLARQPGLESRVALVAWNTLREHGEKLSREEGTLVHGVVVEVMLEEGLDLLSGYADFSARYYNHAGPAIVWEEPESSISEKISTLLKDAKRVVDEMYPHVHVGGRPPPPGRGAARVNMLTPMGIYFAEGPIGAIAQDQFMGPTFQSATELMMGLMDQVENSPTE